jgi:hypothetical protein
LSIRFPNGLTRNILKLKYFSTNSKRQDNK